MSRDGKGKGGGRGLPGRPTARPRHDSHAGCDTACKPASFPTIGNFFSNHWKNGEKFFQSLENPRKIFPIVGKTGGGADGMADGAAPATRAWSAGGMRRAKP